MLLPTIDIALRGATVALLLVLAASLFRGFGTVLAGRLAAAFALGSAAHAVSYSIGSTSSVSISHAPLIALSTGNVVVLWLFTRALFDDAFKLRLRHGLIWAAVVAFSFVNCMWIAPASGARLSIVAINLIALGFIVLAVGQTIASWSSDLVEGRRRVRVFIVSAAALYGGLNAVLQISMAGGGAAELELQVLLDLAGRIEQRPRGKLGGDRSARELEHRRDLGALGRAEALDALELLGLGAQQAREPAEAAEELLGELEDAGADQSGAQQQGDQLGVGERGGPLREQLLARAGRGGNVLEHLGSAGQGAKAPARKIGLSLSLENSLP